MVEKNISCIPVVHKFDNDIRCIFVEAVFPATWFVGVDCVFCSYCGMLKQRKPHLIPEQDFHKRVQVEVGLWYCNNNLYSCDWICRNSDSHRNRIHPQTTCIVLPAKKTRQRWLLLIIVKGESRKSISVVAKNEKSKRIVGNEGKITSTSSHEDQPKSKDETKPPSHTQTSVETKKLKSNSLPLPYPLVNTEYTSYW